MKKIFAVSSSEKNNVYSVNNNEFKGLMEDSSIDNKLYIARQMQEHEKEFRELWNMENFLV